MSFWGWLRSLNTHAIANSGLFTGAVSLATVVGAQMLDRSMPLGGVARTTFDILSPYAMTALAPALAAAYVGRPKTIPPSTSPTV